MDINYPGRREFGGGNFMQAMWKACKELKDLKCFRFHGDPKDWYGPLKAMKREIREVLIRPQAVRTRQQ